MGKDTGFSCKIVEKLILFMQKVLAALWAEYDTIFGGYCKKCCQEEFRHKKMGGYVYGI